MDNHNKTRKPGKIEHRSYAACGVALAAACILLGVGCSNTQHVGDPLKAEIHPQQLPPGQAVYGPNLSTPNQNHNTAGMPPIPSVDGSVSNVSLASMSGGRPLAITASQTSGYSPAPTVMPVQPDPPLSTTSTETKQALDMLQSHLRARGVQWQKQEAVPEGVKFTCYVPNRAGVENGRLYEAVGRDYVSAVSAMIVQIDKNKTD
jgi:hypothetical protein